MYPRRRTSETEKEEASRFTRSEQEVFGALQPGIHDAKERKWDRVVGGFSCRGKIIG